MIATDPIASIECGSVFLLARWSGASVLALRCLRAGWSAAGLPDAELHVLDWDEHAADLSGRPELSGRVHGWGEAFHVRHGSIVHFCVLGREQSTLDHEVQLFVSGAAGA